MGTGANSYYQGPFPLILGGTLHFYNPDGLISGSTGSVKLGFNLASGLTGPTGANGNTSQRGDAGSTGYTGSTGPIGANGNIGFTGADGSIGPTGAGGSIGPTGADGSTGASGSIGPQAVANFWIFLESKPTNSKGGTFATGAWFPRQFNAQNIFGPSTGDVTLGTSGSFFMNQPGTYKIDATTPAVGVASHKTVLTNINSGNFDLIGSASFCTTMESISRLRGIITVTVRSTPVEYQIQHRCFTMKVNDGFGQDEVYAILEIQQLARD